jgi:hypothetical protein
MWYTDVKGKVEEHQRKLGALIRLNFAIGANAATVEECALYKRDPRKASKTGESPENLYPALVEKARQRRLAEQIRAIMKGGKGRRGGAR